MKDQPLPLLARDQERLVPAGSTPEIPPFERYQFPKYGDVVLLVIPTANPEKRRIIGDWVAKQATQNMKIHTIVVPRRFRGWGAAIQ